ncbi:TIGR03668 family PPOX class F420-dependent oxidoreductase [Streptomyces sp. NPDC053499]|uniref:TIGR03668 family PPOX class F420-dependent oxidoreductase n=1 Tax=Streptomyces sp. NPDC053499 TaxID=3365707 RepID=UPI0037D02F3A
MPGMTGEEARRRFAGARLAHLATVDGSGRPHLVPVVFTVRGDTVAFAVDHKPKRTSRLKRLANIEADPRVSLLADHYDEDWDLLWWVRADGTATVLPPADASAASAGHVRRLGDKYRQQYGGNPPAGPVVEIAVARWTGWQATG